MSQYGRVERDLESSLGCIIFLTMNFRKNLFLLLWNSLSSLIKWRSESKLCWWEPKPTLLIHTEYFCFYMFYITTEFFIQNFVWKNKKFSSFKIFFWKLLLSSQSTMGIPKLRELYCFALNLLSETTALKPLGWKGH